MNDEMDPEKPNDVLPYASNAPGSLGTPRPRKIPVLLPVTGAIAAAGAIFWVITGGSTQRCRGATRSAKLQWEGRQAEIDQAIAQENSTRQNPASGG